MKKPEITPGPWKKTRLQDGTSKAPTSWGSRYEILSSKLFVGFTLSDVDATAIAALPDLLEALERAVSIIEDLPHPENIPAQDLRQALVKAGYTF